MQRRPPRNDPRARRAPGPAGLGPRAAGVLRGVVAGYLRTGEPVGSTAALRHARLPVSAATVRVVMGELTQAGLLAQPHTSAGRVPTHEGLRLYVDHLMRARAPSAAQRDGLSAALLAAGEAPEDLVRTASRHLAVTCTRTAVGRRPRVDAVAVDRLQLVALGGDRVLAVLVLVDGTVCDRVVRFEGRADDLARAQNLFNERFAGRTVVAVRAALAAELEGAEADVDPDAPLLRLAGRALPEAETPDDAVFVEGRTHLLTHADDAGRLGEVMRALEDKQLLLTLLDELAAEGGARVVFGDELGVGGLSGCTLVTAAYGAFGRSLGAVAIIGPVRMDYARIVPWVGYTASAISGMLGRAGAR
ncbi:MAG: heat-inducible transcription repressor HrcA [Myxococcales bacterium]|nr:heat-inducible transcription repressor HrcA [Myxococcales bacterium]